MTTSGTQRFCSTALLWTALLCPASVGALELAFPATAALVDAAPATDGPHPLATGPWSPLTGLQTTDALGQVQQFTWQVTGAEMTTTALMSLLRDQIEAQGFSIPFTCFASTCGGFDFRHGLPVGTAPDMHVDLGDFHYLTARSEDGQTQAALMVSRGGGTGFVHLALIQPPSDTPAPVIQSTRSPDLGGSQPSDLIAQLIAGGYAPLDDLQFETGASQLNGESYGSLDALTAFLADDPSRSIVLVGHTDALGSLSGNIALSRARALAVRQYLTETLGVDPSQVEAQGIGFLAPRAPNTTPEGREANRRVEVVRANPG